MGAVSLVRASLPKDILDALKDLSPDEVRRIRAMVPANVLRGIEGALRLEWVHYEDNLRLNEAVYEVIGPARFRALRKKSAGISARSPLLAAVLSGALNLFVRSPRRAYLVVPPVYRLMMRDAGEVVVEDHGAHEVRLVYRDQPVCAVKSAAWRVYVEGALEGVIEMIGLPGEARFIECDVERRLGVVAVTWRDA
jgi:hypothetical protein